MTTKNRENTTQLHDYSNYNYDDVCFDAPIERKIPTNVNVKYLSIPIYTKNREFKEGEMEGKLNGTEGNACIEFPELFSFGVSKFVSQNGDKKSDDSGSYTVSMTFWEKMSHQVKME